MPSPSGARRRAPPPAPKAAPAMAGHPCFPDAGTATRRLFGGAVAARLPRAFLDVSAVRPVPDSQEVPRPPARPQPHAPPPSTPPPHGLSFRRRALSVGVCRSANGRVAHCRVRGMSHSGRAQCLCCGPWPVTELARRGVLLPLFSHLQRCLDTGPDARLLCARLLWHSPYLRGVSQEHPASLTDEECGRHYFQDAAELNGASEASISSTIQLGAYASVKVQGKHALATYMCRVDGKARS